MIEAEQMQDAMDRQVREVIARQLALFGRFARYDGRAKRQIAEQRDLLPGQGLERETEHVGRVIQSAITAIEFARLPGAEHRDIDMPVLARLAVQSGPEPALK